LAIVAAVYTFYRGWTRKPSTQTAVTLTNEGTLCLGAATGGDAGAGADLRAEQPLAIGVRSACLSNSCVTHRVGKCAAKREGSKITVTSELSWQGPLDMTARCSEECAHVEAACATDPLPPGSYTIVLGSQTTTVTLPSHRDRRCPDPTAPAVVVPVATAPLVPIADAAPATGVATPVQNGDPLNVPAAPGTGVAPAPPPKDVVCFAPINPTKKGSRALEAKQPLAITVIKKNPCVGASCASAPPKCVVKRKGFVLTVDPHFPGPTTKPRQPCTEDCSAMVALCKTDALPAGAYTVMIDSQEEHITIPAAAAPPCGQ
jgi:hypothetical protein